MELKIIYEVKFSDQEKSQIVITLTERKQKVSKSHSDALRSQH